MGWYRIDTSIHGWMDGWKDWWIYAYIHPYIQTCAWFGVLCFHSPMAGSSTPPLMQHLGATASQPGPRCLNTRNQSTSALTSKIPFYYLCTMYTQIHTTYVLLACFPHTTNHPPTILPTRHKLSLHYIYTMFVPGLAFYKTYKNPFNVLFILLSTATILLIGST